jgi:hypothetical protein
LVDYVDISGTEIKPRVMSKVEARNGMLVPITPTVMKPAVTPAAQSVSGMDGGVGVPESNLALIRSIANGAGQTNGYVLPKYKGYGINVRN